MAKKRSTASNPAYWWALVICVTAVMAWLLWNTAKTPPAANGSVTSAATNRFDDARVTNLLRWLDTNISTPAAATTTVVKPTIPTNTIPPVPLSKPQTNLALPRSNTFPIPQPTLVITNAPSLVRTNVPTVIERPVRNFLEAQIALARLAISSGPIDGKVGYQTRAAIRAFQTDQGLHATGDLDSATKDALLIAEPVLTAYLITPADLAHLHPVPETWVEKSETESLDYESILELVAEKHEASQNLILSLNPTINWTNVSANTVVKVPNVSRPPSKQRAAFVRIQLAAKTLQAFDSETNLLAHFPCSIAQRVEKRPVGVLTVVTAAENPNYTFDPEVFPESEEARHIDHKLIIPPGPNNPVGSAWISLDKPGYGIHGTPRPEQVGRTESHGCFRLANWNAEILLKMVWAGLQVYVEP